MSNKEDVLFDPEKIDSEDKKNFDEVSPEEQKKYKEFSDDLPPVTIHQFYKAYYDAIQYLNHNYAYWLTYVLNRGRPVLNPSIPTAFVAYNKKRDRIEFHLSPRMIVLPTEQLAFILSHETMHAELKHPKYLTIFEDYKLANVSGDCVINDYLFNRGHDLPEWVMTGFKELGQDTSNMTVREVYERLKQKKKKGEEQGIEVSFGSGSGSGHACGMSEEAQKAIEEWFKENPEMSQIGPDDDSNNAWSDVSDGDDSGKDEDLRKMNNVSSGETPAAGIHYGSGDSGVMEVWAAQTGTELKWAKLLSKLDPRMFEARGRGNPPARDFHGRPRKLSSSSDPHLPIHAQKKKNRDDVVHELPHIVLAIDTSGSVTENQKQKFMTLATSIPRSRVSIWACSFADHHQELDLDHPMWHSGGTSFSAPEEFIQAKMSETGKKYPKAIVVITDGMAVFNRAKVHPDYWNNWFWLLDSDQGKPSLQCAGSGPGDKNVLFLRDFVR